MVQYTYAFGGNVAQGSAEMKDLLGGKGANLAEMTKLGIPVPPGFTIPTSVCDEYYKNGQKLPTELMNQVWASLSQVESLRDKKFNDPENPLLVSVRSGAKISMPGMMDTVLNLGLNDITVKGLAKKAGNERFAYDSYRRFAQMYGDIVMGVKHSKFEEILKATKARCGAKQDTDLSVAALKELIRDYKALIQKETGKSLPQDPKEQLQGAIAAVFGSWNNSRAIKYREINNIPHDIGTAVTVQSMVFGNMGKNSATGVAFTRNMSTGNGKFWGEYLLNAQGEDVVAGIRTPQSITRKGKEANESKLPSMEEELPALCSQLIQIGDRLEKHYKDAQDLEFTIEDGKLYMLQTRTGKRTAKAAVQIAVNMANEGLIDKETAVKRVDPKALNQLLLPQFIDAELKKARANNLVLAKGLAASPGAAVGQVIFDADKAEALVKADKNAKVILVREETSPEDLHGMVKAQGIVTATGGMTSHAAVVTRGMGKPCICGVSALHVDEKNKQMRIGSQLIKEGDWISMDGTTGEVIKGTLKTEEANKNNAFTTFMEWADSFRNMKWQDANGKPRHGLGVRTNAETPLDVANAVKFGAEGIGLARTEHMFFKPERIPVVRALIMEMDREGQQHEKRRTELMEKIKEFQKEDFKTIFRQLKGRPATIRLLDPPLHEFLPRSEEDMQKMAELTGYAFDAVKQRCEELSEQNPMLGTRGIRLAFRLPGLYEMQANAIIEAADEVGLSAKPEIMLPVVAFTKEHDIVNKRIRDMLGHRDFPVGTMVEAPAAALGAGSLARTAQFFSFGTNDLTQTTMMLSRDDTTGIIETYKKQGIIPESPFVSITPEVAEMMALTVERGRKTRPDLKVGICGEQGGDAATIQHCQKLDMDYVSVSPFRVLPARLAAAQAAIDARQTDLKQSATKETKAPPAHTNVIDFKKAGWQIEGNFSLKVS